VECGCLSVWHFILTKLSLLLLNSVASSSETETTHEFRACLMHGHKNSGSRDAGRHPNPVTMV
jgi:hypothetical protein